MESKSAPTLNKRRFWLCLILVFSCGLLCGGVIALCGLRYVRAHFAPPVERIARRITSRIAKDFSLDEATRAAVERDVIILGMEISEQMADTRKSIEASVARRQESIGEIMPDLERKTRWRNEYDKYFPRYPLNR